MRRKITEKLILRDFYLSDDIEKQCEKILGCYLKVGRLVGKIVEVEGYRARDDKACHAYKKITKRNKIMFGPGGHAYPYLCYGVHTLFNIVTGDENHANAILIRAIEPIKGIDKMLKNRGLKELSKNISNGPGKVSQAMGISLSDYGRDLVSKDFGIFTPSNSKDNLKILRGRRIGIDYAGGDKHLPWRYALDNPYVSHLKKIKNENSEKYWQ